jgi:hypothetical protein
VLTVSLGHTPLTRTSSSSDKGQYVDYTDVYTKAPTEDEDDQLVTGYTDVYTKSPTEDEDDQCRLGVMTEDGFVYCFFLFRCVWCIPDGSPIISKSHTHPSHSQTSRLLTSSLSLVIPVPRTTQCM